MNAVWFSPESLTALAQCLVEEARRDGYGANALVREDFALTVRAAWKRIAPTYGMAAVPRTMPRAAAEFVAATVRRLAAS